jgi:hypothetical protein
LIGTRTASQPDSLHVAPFVHLCCAPEHARRGELGGPKGLRADHGPKNRIHGVITIFSFASALDRYHVARFRVRKMP